MTSDIHYAVAIFTLRVIAGILFCFQGYDKVFHVGMSELKQTMRAGIGKGRLPDGAISVIAPLTSWIELVCGFLLIIGLFKFTALYLLCINLIIVVFGFSLSKPMWENNHVFIRLLLIITLLFTPGNWDLFSLDYLLDLSELKN